MTLEVLVLASMAVFAVGLLLFSRPRAREITRPSPEHIRVGLDHPHERSPR